MTTAREPAHPSAEQRIEWAGPFPDRIIPVQIPWLSDRQISAQKILRNAERGSRR